MEGDYKIVHFDKYCDTCKHKATAENKKPCHECLNNPTNIDSHKPVNWEEGPKKQKKS